MFHKPFRVKTQTSIKGSDRKKLRGQLAKQFPLIPPDKLPEIVPNKDEMYVMKIETHSGDNIVVYLLQKNPAFFEYDRHVYPTVYTLWKFPEILTVFTTWPPVFGKILKGADLMLPGVIVPGGQVTPWTYKHINKGDLCSIKLLGNKAPVAIGKTGMSGGDMYESAMRGKGIVVVHCYQDQLWAHGDKSHPPVLLDQEMLDEVKKKEGQLEEEDEDDEEDDDDDEETDEAQCGTALEGAVMALAQDTAAGDLKDVAQDFEEGLHLKGDHREYTDDEDEGDDTAVAEAAGQQEDEESPEELMDELLTSCLLCALKTNIKKSDLPLLTSKLFKTHMQPCCPAGQSVDVKKSSYKKLSRFLQAMQSEGMVKVRELTKGVQSITEVNWQHAWIQEFVQPMGVDGEALAAANSVGTQHHPTKVTEIYCVSGDTQALFKAAGYQKGHTLSGPQARDAITAYINVNNLQDPKDRSMVKLDQVLSDVALNIGERIDTLPWDALIQRCMERMNAGHQMALPGQKPMQKKGKVPPIVITVAKRMGNKKVTLIHNLESYSVDLQEFAHTVQKGVACSAAINPLPGKNKGMEVLVQGNQINYIAPLLIDTYHVPRKSIQGLELAPKPKKKNR